MKNILKHWKTTLAGLVIGFLTVLLSLGKITVTEWIEGFGAVSVIVGLIARDWDKATK